MKSVKLPVVLLTQQMSYNDHSRVSDGKKLINEIDLSQNELILLMKLCSFSTLLTFEKLLSMSTIVVLPLQIEKIVQVMPLEMMHLFSSLKTYSRANHKKVNKWFDWVSLSSADCLHFYLLYGRSDPYLALFTYCHFITFKSSCYFFSSPECRRKWVSWGP